MPRLLDPELYVIRGAILAAKRYLLRCSPQKASAFLDMVCCHSGTFAKCRGPAGTLRNYLNRIDWQLDRQGYLHVTAFRKIPLVFLSARHLTECLLNAWSQDLLTLHSSRKAWKGLPPINALETKRVIAKFDHQQQKALLNEVSGAFQTNAQQASWDLQISGECSYCSCLDTREHRIYECAATEEVRRPFANLLHTLRDEGLQYHELPVIASSHDVEFFQTVCDFIALPPLDETLQTRLARLITWGHTPRFYTDGSCQYPNVNDASHAAYAVVLDLTQTSEERAAIAANWQPGTRVSTLQTILLARLTGRQNIHRAEISAMIYICELVSAADIFSDSQVAVDLGNQCNLLLDSASLHTHAEPDLAIQLWQVVQGKTFAFKKIKAHQDVATCPDLLLRYDRLGNQQANDAAFAACQELQPRLVQQADEIAHHLVQQKQWLEEYYRFFLELQRDRAKLRKQSHQYDQHVLQPPGQDTMSDKLVRYAVEDPWPFPTPEVDHSRDFAWGTTWSVIFLDWISRFRWPQEEGLHSLQDLGITWIELAISLMLWADMWIPLRRQGHDFKDRLIIFSSYEDLSAYGVVLSEFADSVQQMCAQMQTLRDAPLFPEVRRQLVRSTYVQGWSIHSSGLSQRPQLPNQTQMLSFLSKHLQTNKGPGWTAIPDLCLRGAPGQLQQIRLETHRSWTELCLQSQRSARRLRDYKRLTLRPLKFHP
eukprot:Skav228427  [mRNA]  locus=scaffold1325:335853:337982:- [translate_table: standard]